MSQLRSALEAALLDSPDDRATWAAYADHLTESGDPRGELIAVQLALEEQQRPATERKKLKTREKRILAKHEREWLGELAPYLLDNDTAELDQDYDAEHQRYGYRWERGFLAALDIHWLTVTFAQKLATAPAAWMLRELRLHSDAGYWEEEAEPNPPPLRVPTPRGAHQHLALFELIGSPCLRNLRVLQVGDEQSEESWTDCHCYTPALERVVATMPRIEELVLLTKNYSTRNLFKLPNLTNLRFLHVYHASDYPLKALAANPALANLTHLWLHPHQPEGGDPRDESYLRLEHLRALIRSPHLKKLSHLRFRMSSAGDDGIKALVRSGFLRQLRVLDLRHGEVTDQGAALLAACPDARNLELLDLTRNQLTPAGVALLKGAGITVRCPDQHPVGSTEYLHEGDFE